MSASKLSEVMNGRREISPRAALKLTQALKLDTGEAGLFLDLVDWHQKKNPLVRALAKDRLEKREETSGFRELDLDTFKVIADWHHFAILELTEVKGFKSQPSWIAKRLGLPEADIIQAIERLLELNLLVKNSKGELHQTRENLATPTDIPSQAIRAHHSQLLMRADKALEDVVVAERDFSAITLSFDPAEIRAIKQEIREFRRRLIQRIQSSESRSRLYCLTIQFFPLDQQELEKPSDLNKPTNRRKKSETNK